MVDTKWYPEGVPLVIVASQSQIQKSKSKWRNIWIRDVVLLPASKVLG